MDRQIESHSSIVGLLGTLMCGNYFIANTTRWCVLAIITDVGQRNSFVATMLL